MRTLRCKNPRCQREFTLDADHRHLPFCCAGCQRECTPNTTVQRTVGGQTGIVVSRAPLARKHGRDRREVSE